MRRVDCIQGSAEWLQIRCGRVTASRIVDVMAKLRDGSEGAPRRNYRMELLAERLTGRSADHYVSPEMVWGSEQELFARTAYELQTEAMVDCLGFVIHPELDYSGASPDSLVGTGGGLEIKCPKTTTHIGWRLAGIVPPEYEPQMQWNMACCEREWWDFVSYDPRVPGPIQLFGRRLHRDEQRIAEMQRAVIQLQGELEAMFSELGLPPWDASVPSSHAELNAVTERVGGLEVPIDILNMLDQRELCP